jgi:hypothetical protein
MQAGKLLLKPCSSIAGHQITWSHNLEDRLLKFLLARSLSNADFANIKMCSNPLLISDMQQVGTGAISPSCVHFIYSLHGVHKQP